MSKKNVIAEECKEHSESVGVSAAVILAWLITTYSGVDVPAEIVAAFSGLIGTLSAKTFN